MTKNKPQPKKKVGLDFDPRTVIKQHEKIQSIGQTVCYRIAEEIGDYAAASFRRVDYGMGDKQMVNLFYNHTWWNIPYEVFQQGVDTIVKYISDKHKAEIEENRKAVEKADKARAERWRQQDLAEYERLKEKLWFNNTEQNNAEKT